MVEISGKTKIAAVIGKPIAHSMSPLLHNFWFKNLGIDGAYIPLEVAEDDFLDVVQALQKAGFSGVNVTIPHKQRAVQAVSELSEPARLAGAVNTILFRRDGVAFGTNTDGEGFMRNLAEHAADFSLAGGQVTMIGAGGAARSIGLALTQAGIAQLTIINRTHQRAEALAETLAPHTSALVRTASWEKRDQEVGDSKLLINTTSAGMNGHCPLHIDLNGMSSDAVVSDIVYNPLKTPLLTQAEELGLVTVDGLGMLLHQAVPGFLHWGGQEPAVTAELREMIVRHLKLR